MGNAERLLASSEDGARLKHFTTLLLFLFSGASAASTLPRSIQKYLNEPGFTWKCAAGQNFYFCWESSLDQNPNMARARQTAEAGREKVLKFANAPAYEHTIYVFFVESPDRMKALIGYHGEGRSRPAEHAVFFVPTPIRPDLTHELTHEIVTNLWGAAEPWIEEGLASYLAEPNIVHMTCLTMTIRKAMLPLSDLVRADWIPSKYSPDITYVELGGFLEFLIKQYVIADVKRIWQQGSASMTNVIGKTLRVLEADWHEQLQQEIAAKSRPAPN